MTTIAQGIIEFGGDASGVTAAAAEVGKSLDSIGSKVKTLGNESGDGFKKVEDGAKGAAKATQTWNEYLKENIAEARKQFAAQDLSKADAYSASVKKVAESWKEMQRARQSASTPIPLGVGDVDALTKAQDRLLNSIARQATVVTEGKAKWLELRAAQAGISEQATPYIAKLKSIEKSTSDLGISQGQLTAAMRNVPAQFTDIITSLQGGQKPLTVLLQQGGQLKDMFGGAGNAAKALGGYVLGLVNPFTVAAAAIGGIAYAYSQSNETAKGFQKTLILTGNAAGTTSDQMIQITKDIAAVGAGSVKSANEAVNALAATGKVSYSVLEQATLATVRAQDLLGKSVQDTSKEFAELSKSPTKSIADLNEKYNFLTLDIYKQIKALEDQGRSTEAASLAQTTYADSLISNASKVNETLTDWERGWLRIKKATSDVADAALRIFDEDTTKQKIDKFMKQYEQIENLLKDAQKNGDTTLISRYTVDLDQYKRQINILRDVEDSKIRNAKAQEASNKAVQAGIEFAKQGNDYLSKSAKMQKELTAATALYLAGSTEKNQRTEKDIELTTRLAKIREKYKESVSKEESAYQSLSRTISEKVALSQVELNSEKPLTEAQKLRVKLMELVASSHGKITQAQEIEQKKKIDLIRSNELARLSYEGLRKELEKFKPSVTADDLVANIIKKDKAYSDITETQRAYRQSLQDNADLMQLENNLAGQSATDRNTAIEQYKIEIALQKELLKIKEDINLSDARKNELSYVARENANIAKSQAALKAQQGEWSKFYGDIYNGLTDSLYRGFEAGKGFGKSFLDSIKNLFKTNAIKIVVQAVMGGAGGMVSSMASAMSGGGESGGAGSYISMGKSIYEGFSSGFTGFGDSVANYVQAGLDKAGLSMTGGGNSALASGAGTAASYLGGAAVGIYGGRAISGGYSVTGGNAAVNIGTLAGAIFGGPIGAAIGGLIGGGINRLFGMKAAELQSSEMSGTVGAGGFQASTKDTYLAKGGLFRSDKWSSTTTAATDTAGLTAEYEAIKAAATGYASMLGLSATAVESYTKSFSFSISKTGDAAKDAESNQKNLTDLFIGISDDITKLVAPSISALSKTGETAAQTLGRLAIGLTSVNGIMNAAGFSEFAKSLEGASAANRLAELTGGIENLSAGTQFFVENFLNDAEKIKPSIDQVAATMARLGMSNVKTIEDFKLAIKGGEDASGKLVQGLDLTTESGAKMYAELIAIAPQFKAVADYVTETTKAVEDNTAALQRAKQIEDERKSLQDEYNQLTMTSTQLYNLYKNGLDESNRSLADSIQAIKLKSTEEAAAAAKLAEEQTKANAIASERSSIQNEINQLTMTSAQLLDLQRNGLNEANRALFDFLQATKDKIAGDKQLADMQKSIDNERVSLMSELNDLTMTNEQRLQLQRFAINEVNVGIYDQIVALKEKTKADAEAAATAKVIADQRKSLQDEYNNLMMTEAQLLDLRRSNYDAANRDLFDLIQAEKATRTKALEDQKAYNDSIAELQRQAQAIAAERSILQDEYNQLTMTEIQLMELKRSTLNESNRDLFDLIQAEKLRRNEAAKAEEAAKNSQSEWAQAMKDAYDTQKGIFSDIVSEFGSLLKSLKDFGRNLTTGDLSKASPEDKYKLLGAEVAGLIPKVQSGDKKAIADFMDVADEYLKASEDYNALNTQYFKDKDYIKKYIDEAAAYAQGQVDVATMQLNAINGNIAATNSVNASIQQVLQAITAGSGGASSSGGGSAMTALSGYGGGIIKDVELLGGKDALLNGALSGDPYGRRNLQKQLERWNRMGLNASDMDMILGKGWLDKFIEALGIPKGLFGDQINFSKYIKQNMQQIPGFAKGGLANGLSMVGENGAELVNFKSPARVYNSNDTKSILGGNPEASKETNDLLKKQNALMEKLISKLEGTANKNQKGLENVAQKIGVVNANAKFQMAGT